MDNEKQITQDCGGRMMRLVMIVLALALATTPGGCPKFSWNLK